MIGITKTISVTFLLIAIFIFGTIMGLRSCLSKYDERSALPRALYFKNDSNAILFSLVKFSKATSYSRNRGLIHKTVRIQYFIQTNNAVTAEKIAQQEIKSDEKTERFPQEVMGASGNNVWIFLNELVAINAFTFARFADVKTIENNNRVLKGMLPKERQYYHFNETDKTIRFTANDGAEWILNTTTLKAEPFEPTENSTIDAAQKYAQKALKDVIEKNSSLGESLTNQDTSNARWTGLYSDEEINKLNQTISFAPENQRQQRRQLYASSYSLAQSNFVIDLPGIQKVNNTYFLDAGFLRDKSSGSIIHPANTTDFLISYKSSIASDSKIILASISKNGIVNWQFETGFSEWNDWICKDNRLFIFGRDNKDLDSKEFNVLLIVDLKNGPLKKYDYFNDKSGL